MSAAIAMTLEERMRALLGALQDVRQTGPHQWIARCPCHDDSKASFSISDDGARPGYIVCYCQAKCDTNNALRALGFEPSTILFPPREDREPREPERKIVKTYDYVDADGSLLFQVVRFDPKDFRQRKPDGDGWSWKVAGVKQIPYRLQELLAADPSQVVFVVEGEKSVDKLRSLGLVATCSAGGAGKWKQHHADFLVGRHVVILPDNDRPGREHADTVAATLYGVAASVRILALGGLADKADPFDWIEAGGTADELRNLAARAEEWTIRDRLPPVEARAIANELDTRLHDAGNALRFTRQHGDNVRFSHQWGKWLLWDNTRWDLDCLGGVERLAKLTADSIYREAADIADGRDQRSVAEWAHKSHSAGAIAAMLKLARSEPPIPVHVDSLDAEPWLLNCINGTLELTTGVLREHRRGDFITKRCPVEYPTEAGDEPVLWLEFLDRILAGDSELIGFVQRLMGASLAGEVRDHILPVFWGKGANGKSTLLETWSNMLGDDYAMKAPQGFLMQKRGESHPTELADLFGKRLVTAIETADGQRISEALVKELTGGDTIRARRMREDFWQFRPSHTVVLATNHKPSVRGTDEGIWRRLRLVPFNVRISDDERDGSLKEKLRMEWPQILRWSVEGCLAWQRCGLSEPASVIAETKSYRESSDIFGQFIDECCICLPNLRVKAGEIYDAYREWAGRNGEFIESQTKFGTRLSERGFVRWRSSGNWWVGITTRAVGEVTQDAA